MNHTMKYCNPTLHPVYISIFICLFFLATPTMAQKLEWKNVSNEFGLTTNNIQVFTSTSNTLNDSAFKAYYVLINTNAPNLQMGVDTTLYRRLTPSAFYERLVQPAVVMNASFLNLKTTPI